MSQVENVKVKYIRPKGYNNLEEWVNDPNNVYIGRGGIVFINTINGKERFPKQSSIWANPFKIGKQYTRETCLVSYKNYIVEKIKTEPNKYDLNTLKNKNLGCWCHPDPCHGDILLELTNDIN